MKLEPKIEENDEGIVAWMTSDGEIAIDVQLPLWFQYGRRFTPERARRLARELVELAGGDP